GVAPSIWDTPTGLVPADTFIPGASPSAAISMSVVGPSGSSVPLTLTLIGMEYNTPEALSHRSDSGGGGASTTFLNSLIQVRGTGLGNEQVQLIKEVSPFTHARPIFSLGDNEAIMRAFEHANAKPGAYLAQVTMPVVYDYIRKGVRVRHNWSLPLRLEIEYTPSVLTDIEVTSPTQGVMTPRYYTLGGTRSVRGEAVFNGVATGMFTNGLRMKLKAGDSYQMEEVAPEASPGIIPYSVTCGGCESAELVINGGAVSGMITTGTRVAGSNVNTITFSINVSFSDVALIDLHTGTYRDEFSLLFEPDV
ncbi:TPA: hypothetical protein P2Q92_001136, partial [Aeromonas veronii]|nr:hypothetical protein [Aeromonas veronii]